MSESTILLTLFDDRYATQATRVHALCFSPAEFRDFLAKPPVCPTREDCPLFNLAGFGDRRSEKGSLRHNANVTALGGIVGDYDGEEVSLEEAQRRLTTFGIDAYLYTSPSYTHERPRWRVVAPFSHVYEDTPEARGRLHTHMLARLNGVLGGVLDPQAWDLSHAFWIGRVNGHPYESVSTRDYAALFWSEQRIRPIDQCDDLDADALDKHGKPFRRATGEGDEPGALQLLQDVPGAEWGSVQGRAKIHAALDAIVNLEADKDPYEHPWLTVGMVLKHESGGDWKALQLWETWSAQRKNYTPDGPNSCAAKWETFGTEPKRGEGRRPRTVRTLYRLADQHAPGWRRSPEVLRAAVRHADGRGIGDDGRGTEAATAGAQDLERVPEARHLTTDQANARRLADTFGAGVFFTGGRWFCWVGTHWAADEGEVLRSVMQLSTLILAEAAEWERRSAATEDERAKNQAIADALRKWSKQCEMKPRIDAAFALLRKLLEVSPDAVDADPWALNVLNGTIDLRTGELRPHDKAQHITRLTPLAYAPAGQAPRWLQFLREITNDTPGLVEFLARWFGYCATGSTREEAFAVLWGDGGNGKTRLVGAIESVLGPYAGAAAPHLLMAGGQNRHETEVADLFGLRMVTAAESSEGGELAEAQVKRITGGDRIKARRMRQDHFEFTPTHKVNLMTNHKPVIKGQDRGIWRRVMLVPFVVTFGTAEEVTAGRAARMRDPDLGATLLEERAGILAWLVAGARQWFEQGLAPPDVVLAATESYRTEQDRVGQFLAEECELMPDAWGLLQSWGLRVGLYGRYQQWCKESGYHALGLNKFKAEIERRVPGARSEARTTAGGYEGKRATKAGMWGVRLKGDD